MYSDFSSIYDTLIDVDYTKFVSYYKEIFARFEKQPELILDLGCGTGTLTSLMQKEGYDMQGADMSYDMLMKAREKCGDILFLNQSMTEFELYGTVDVIYSSLDCVNYLLTDDELLKTFSLVNNYLNPKGLYIFDISSRYKLENLLGNNTFVYDDGNIFYAWENCFEDNILDLHISFFEKQGSLYRRIDEEQSQRAYEPYEITALAEHAGLRTLGVYAPFSFEEPKDTDERIFFVMSEDGK